MFSGIVQGTAEITAAIQRDDVLTIEIELGKNLIEGLEIGASVSVDGVCLTAVEIAESTAKFDIIEEIINPS